MGSSADEIAKIEHELAILRERYAIYQRGAEWVRRTLIVAVIVIAGLILVAASSSATFSERS